MPMMLGFSHHRAGQLQKELDRIVDELPQLGVQKCILLNPLYPGSVSINTTLRLVMILPEDRPFVRRADFFYGHLWPNVAVEFLHYTPEEIKEISHSNTALSKEIKEGQLIYEQ